MSKDYIMPKLPIKKDDGNIDPDSLFNFCKNILELLQKKIVEDYKATTDAQSSADSAQTVLQNFAVFVDEKANGQAGGDATSGSWLTRTLNTEKINNIDGCSLSSNIISLPEGTYIVLASAPTYATGGHKIRLYDNTNSTQLIIGQNANNAYSAYYNQTATILFGTFELTATANIILQHKVYSSKASNGLGILNGFSVNEVYANLMLWKIA